MGQTGRGFVGMGGWFAVRGLVGLSGWGWVVAEW